MSVGDAKGVVADPRFEGLEFDWLAVDGRGFVAIFSTAGSMMPGGPYRRVAIPSQPARVEALPSVVAAVAAVLPEVSSGQAESVDRPGESAGA